MSGLMIVRAGSLRRFYPIYTPCVEVIRLLGAYLLEWVDHPYSKLSPICPCIPKCG